mmetsp:Transcript_19353/g.48754  ORF Transcript_19353/g.48754 Transcript_19353/m.48754 type:complete len:493 (+) Transcript_19353:173-1651(+)
MPTGIEQRRPSETDQLYKMTRAMNSSMSEAGASGEGRAVSDGGTDEQLSQHGSSATQRRALLDMLFFCSVGDVARVEEICKTWRIDVSDAKSCDYDKRYPIHLAASEGCFSVVDWLIKNKADVNVIDRFKHTPLEDAVRGDHIEVAKLLSNAGGMVMYQGKLVNLDHSQFAGYVKMYTEGSFENELEWEVDPSNINIGTVIGRGEFGTVYSARWHNTLVAVKVLKSTSKLAVEELKSELNALRKAHHPHTMQFLGACTKQTPYMLVTELMSGGSLQDAFQLMNFQLPLRRGLEIALDAARGMNYLHTRKPSPIIHRDLKPGNFMIGGSVYSSKSSLVQNTGVVKIADFGLSKTLPTSLANHDDQYKMTGETGTYRYMAPEVFRHEPYNAKVDVYSFAMLCFELFEARAPFDRMDAVNVAKAVALEGNRPIMLALDKPNDPVRSELKALIERMWHSDPRARPDFTEVITGLTQLIRKVPRSTIQGEKACCAVQ